MLESKNNHVAIVIVCMNNLKNLIPCLDSIAEFTNIAHEIWINCYMFSDENLAIIRRRYPYVHIVVNNEIAGFSENNNIILKQLDTEYVLILNDDTIFKEPVLDRLVDSIQRTPDAAIMAPKLLNGDGSLQYCGKAPYTIWDFIVATSSIGDPGFKKSIYINQDNIFRTYNICGACFLIKRAIFEELGWFDEYYFFCPEDIALSTLANQRGYSVYCDSNISLYHLQGKTSSIVKPATLPAARKGSIKFYSKGSLYLLLFLKFYIFILCTIKTIFFFLKKDKINYMAQWHCVETIFTSLTPKDIFIKYYTQIKKIKA